MNVFKTSDDAIAAAEAECSNQWLVFAKVNNINPEQDEVAYGIARQVFRAGFMFGSAFIATHLTNITEKIKNEVEKEKNDQKQGS